MKVTVVTIEDTGLVEQYVAVVEGIISPEDRLRIAENFGVYILAPDEDEEEDGRYLYFREVELAKLVDDVHELVNKKGEGGYINELLPVNADANLDPVNPELYVFQNKGKFYVAPYHGDSVINSCDDVGPFSVNGLLNYISSIDVSLMLNGNGDIVHWIHGSEVTEKILKTLKQTNLR